MCDDGDNDGVIQMRMRANPPAVPKEIILERVTSINAEVQKYYERGAPSGVVGSCPRIAWPTSSWHVALVVCKLVARKKCLEN